MRYVVAVAGPPGAGKTSLVGATAKILTDATMISFDSYETATERPMRDIVEWTRNGSSYDDFVLPELSRGLEKLKNGEAVADPLTGLEIRPRKYILFETPLGKAHADTARHIDLLVWIDVPLDVALARKIGDFNRLFLARPGGGDAAGYVSWLAKYVENYLVGVRDTLQVQRERVAAGADIVVDGLAPLDAMAAQTAREITRKLP